MGNGLSITPCLHLPGMTTAAAVRLVYWGGQARLLLADDDGARVTAGDVAAELPGPATDHAVVCPADAFFVGLPIPVMSPGEELLPGRTYFVLPASRFPSLKVLTAATLAALSAAAPAGRTRKAAALPFDGKCPFEYVKGDGGAALIRVLPEFIEKVITCDGGPAAKAPKATSSAAELCSTPELKRHYAQLVGPRRSRAWSPRLETIAESDGSRWLRSPARMLSSR